MAVEVRHQNHPAGPKHTGHFPNGRFGVGKMVQHQVDARKIRLAVTQRQMVQLADTQGYARAVFGVLGVGHKPKRPHFGYGHIVNSEEKRTEFFYKLIL